ncbi:nuclear transport factor 2 family protein [Sandaracinus amylolyticus]|uniref:nuclear transport factor 2 family protein n=1 Tax=Sandaracinus amylolyticus TaxID=927083 RepID=UPI001F3CBBBD|nr:nuclear transport factor 2 family protein [Sandaracinus amylolyticus]UJR83606.1 Hypothetical protein I5071_56740 [Sandaracinus amylolyticus]
MTDPDDTTPIALARALYAATSTRDEARLRALLDPEIEWIQCAGFPGGGHRRGVDEVFEKVLAGNSGRWIGFRADVEELLESGDTVVALGTYSGTRAETGLAMRVQFAHVVETRGGRIVRFRQIADTWPMVAAIRGEVL